MFGVAVCRAGTFSTGNALTCTPCDLALLQYQEEEGQTRCKTCACCGSNITTGTPCLAASGERTPSILSGCPGDGTVGPGVCLNCRAGKYNDPSAGAGDGCAVCSACPGGFQRTNCKGDDDGSCQACVAGKFKPLDATSTWNTTCQLCATGTYSEADSQSGIRNCTHCPEGQYGDEEGQDDCKPCVLGLDGPVRV